jgi:hypothetical protein
MPFEHDLISESNFRQLAWSPFTWSVDTTSYPGLMGRSIVAVAFAKRQARTSKIKAFFTAMVFVYACYRSNSHTRLYAFSPKRNTLSRKLEDGTAQRTSRAHCAGYRPQWPILGWLEEMKK